MTFAKRLKLPVAFGAIPLATALAIAPLAPATAAEVNAPSVEAEATSDAPETTPTSEPSLAAPTATDPTTQPTPVPNDVVEPIETDGLTFDLTMGGEAIVTHQTERVLGPGVVLTEFERLEPQGWQRGAVLDVDLGNEAVTLDYLYSGEVTKTATVTEMAENAENIAAAINGDFFDINNSGAPNGIGVDPVEGIIKTPQWGSSNALILDSNNIAQITDVWTEGTVWIKQEPASEPNDIGIRIDGVNVPGIPTNDVAVYTDVWGEKNRLIWEADRDSGIEVWVDETSTVTKIQAPGAGEIPANTRIIAARPGGYAYDQLSQLAVGDKVQIAYTLRSNASDAEVGISGGDNLVVGGEIQNHTRTDVHPRTAVGVNESGTRLLLAVIDGRSVDSRGMSLAELSSFMHGIGAHNAINFDGGGSSQMIARDPGDTDTDVVNSPSDGHERSNSNGLGVQIDPGTSDLVSFDVETADGMRGSTEIFPGLSRQLLAQGMNENLVAVEGEATWSSSNPEVATVDETGKVSAVAPGEVTITASSGDASGSIDLVVRGELVRIIPNRIHVGLMTADATQNLVLTGYDANGFGAPIDVSDIAVDISADFSLTPVNASTLKVSANADSASALATLTVVAIETKIPMTVGTESNLVTDLADADGWTFAQARATGEIAASTDDEGNNAIRLTYDFTTSTGTRGAYAIAPGDGIAIAGQPMAITMKVKGDGTGVWPRLQMKDGDGATIQVNASNPEYIDFEGWQTVEYSIPAGTSYPLTLQRVRLMETSPAQQYMGDITFSDISATVAPDVEFPEVEVYEDPAVDPAGSADDAPLKIAVVSDAQFVGRNPDSAQVTAARESLRAAVAADPDRIIILGDWVDEGAPEDIELAQRIIDEELAESGIEWIYVPGNHEAMNAPGMTAWHEAFGPGYTSEVVNGTKIITLDSHPYNISHNPEQIKFLRAELDDAIASAEVTGVVLALHHPTQDNITGASALKDSQDAALIENWMAEVYDAGKSAVVLNAGVGAFDVYQVDGVTHVTNGNAGKSPNSTPDRGGFSGWTLIGIDPEGGLWQESDAEWLTVDIKPFVNAITIEGPESVESGSSILLSGTVDENGRLVPIDWPVSYRWGSETDTLHVGDPSTAAENAVAAIDSREGTVTALDRVWVDGELAIAGEDYVLTDGAHEIQVTANVLVNGKTATHTVTILVPHAQVKPREAIRIAGKNRVATSVASVDAIAEELGSIDSLVLAGFDGVADAVTGTPLAHALGTGVAYTKQDALSPQVKELIERHAITSVTVLGGQNAVSEAVLDELRALGVDVKRVSGKNRWATSVAIAHELEDIADVDRIIYASGTQFADALVAGPLAAKTDAAILLTRDGGVPTEALEFATQFASDGFYAVGGDAKRATASMDGLIDVYAGRDRYATAAHIVEAQFMDATTVALSNGMAEPDAAVAGAYAAHNNTGVLLARPDSVPATTARLLANFSKIAVFGGTSVVPNTIFNGLVK